ncbi:YegP family protein [Budvicia diplopodorum]|uniref:YegP family protein n=1 Tax=Budvicia diplopodorum TaxID=1119056 RepID=UPI0013589497|nr:YegP family protein [Budvicia diplopodorum]
MRAKFEIFYGKDDRFYFRLKAGNGQVILGSEGYTTKANCINGIKSVKSHASEPRYFEKKVTVNGKFSFNLKASNGQIVATSQTYTTEQSRDAGIHSVSANGPEAETIDLTAHAAEPK